MPKVLCTLGVVLVCLHTFVVVRTSPMGRQTPSSLQRSLKRNLTALSRIFNLTTNDKDPRDTTDKYYYLRTAGLAKYKLARAPFTNVHRVRLFSKHQYFLQMSKGGYVDGTLNNTGNPNVLFDLQSVQVRTIRIKHVASGRYLGMDKHGILRGRIYPSLETLFLETLENGYHRFSSYKYKMWYLAIRKNGSQKPGRHTEPRQTSVQFLTFRT